MRIFALSAAALLLSGALPAQFPNDECVGAIPVVTGANGPFHNFGALPSLPLWPCGLGSNSDLWFVYTPTCTGNATFDTCGTFTDTVLQVFEQNPCVGNTCASQFAGGGPCNDNSCGLQSRVTLSVAADRVYYIRVGTSAASSGFFWLNIACTGHLVGPPDDRCGGATPVSLGVNGPFGHSGYTESPPLNTCRRVVMDRWFAHVATFTGPHTIDTCSSTSAGNITLEAFGGPCCALVPLGCSVDGCPNGSRLVGVPFVQGQTYYLRAGIVWNRDFHITIVPGTGTGSITRMATACRGGFHIGIDIAVSGDANIGGQVTVQTWNTLFTTPFIGFGLQAAPFPMQYSCCVIGHDFGISIPTTALSVPIPLNALLVGQSIYTQGIAVGQHNGCASDSLNFTDTVRITIG